MKERRLAVSPKRTEHLLECAKRSPERDWSSTAAILLAGDADQHVQQLPGCPIVCTLQQLEAQSLRHLNASLPVEVSKSIEKRPIRHGLPVRHFGTARMEMVTEYGVRSARRCIC